MPTGPQPRLPAGPLLFPAAAPGCSRTRTSAGAHPRDRPARPGAPAPGARTGLVELDRRGVPATNDDCLARPGEGRRSPAHPSPYRATPHVRRPAPCRGRSPKPRPWRHLPPAPSAPGRAHARSPKPETTSPHTNDRTATRRRSRPPDRDHDRGVTSNARPGGRRGLGVPSGPLQLDADEVNLGRVGVLEGVRGQRITPDRPAGLRLEQQPV
jgi:hypothetical protein